MSGLVFPGSSVGFVELLEGSEVGVVRAVQFVTDHLLHQLPGGVESEVLAVLVVGGGTPCGFDVLEQAFEAEVDTGWDTGLPDPFLV